MWELFQSDGQTAQGPEPLRHPGKTSPGATAVRSPARVISCACEISRYLRETGITAGTTVSAGINAEARGSDQEGAEYGLGRGASIGKGFRRSVRPSRHLDEVNGNSCGDRNSRNRCNGKLRFGCRSGPQWNRLAAAVARFSLLRRACRVICGVGCVFRWAAATAVALHGHGSLICERTGGERWNRKYCQHQPQRYESGATNHRYEDTTRMRNARL